MNLRQKAIKLYNARYDRLYQDVKNTGVCFYCGEYSILLDHYPPITKAEYYDTSADFMLIPSCKECNSLLSDSVQDSLIDRVNYIKSKLAKRYSGLIKANHTDDELEQWQKDDPKSDLLKLCMAVKAERDIILTRLEYTPATFQFKNGDYNISNCDLSLAMNVNGKRYESLDHAINECSKLYNINKIKLKHKLKKLYKN